MAQADRGHLSPGAATAGQGLEPLVLAVEQALDALAGALRHRDAPAIESASQGLQQALERMVASSRPVTLPRPLHERLMQASRQVSAQRGMVQRAASPVERGLQILLPRQADPVYGRGPGAARYGL